MEEKKYQELVERTREITAIFEKKRTTGYIPEEDFNTTEEYDFAIKLDEKIKYVEEQARKEYKKFGEEFTENIALGLQKTVIHVELWKKIFRKDNNKKGD